MLKGLWAGDAEVRRRRLAGLIVAGMVLLIVCTRLAGLRHGAEYHRDEAVFYDAASSIFKGDYSFQMPKLYPNGAIVFYMPFHFVARMLQGVLGGELDAQMVGRLAAVAYYVLGCLLGARLCWRLSQKNLWALFFYAATMVFSLFHIEQSRYGTGDVISFFLLFLILSILDIYIKEGDAFYLMLAGFFTGALAATRFSLMVYLVLPVAALLMVRKRWPGRLVQGLALLLFIVVGLLAFSPSFFGDPAFFQKALVSELNAYTTGGLAGNPGSGGGPVGNLLSVVVYQLLYADFPLALPLAVGGAVWLYRKSRADGHANALYTLVLPLFSLVFLAYNTFTTVHNYRTFYPWFVTCNLYAALGLARLMQSARWKKLAVGALCAFMAVRGGVFTLALMQPSTKHQAIEAMVAHPSWQDRNVIVTLGGQGGVVGDGLPQRQYAYMPGAFTWPERPVALLPGEFGIDALMDDHYSRKAFFLRDDGYTDRLNAGWGEFMAQYGQYQFAAFGPSWYNAAFGGWTPGSTLSITEFPRFRVFYNGDTGVWGTYGRHEVYQALYEETDALRYLDSLAQLQGVTLVAAKQGQPTEACFGLEKLPMDAVAATPGYSGIVVMRDGDVLYETAPPQAVIRSDLSAETGFGCVVSVNEPADHAGAVFSGIWYAGRDYGLPGDGLLVLVYDDEFGCVMDWFLLTERDGVLVLQR